MKAVMFKRWINKTRPFKTNNVTLGMDTDAPARRKRLDKSEDLRNQAFQVVMTDMESGM
jgi:hypothetical protein